MEWTIDKMGVDNGRTKTLKWRKEDVRQQLLGKAGADDERV